MTDKKTLTLGEFVKMGGEAWKKKYGMKKYSEMGKNSAEVRIAKYSTKDFRRFAYKAVITRSLNRLKKQLESGEISKKAYTVRAKKIQDRFEQNILE